MRKVYMPHSHTNTLTLDIFFEGCTHSLTDQRKNMTVLQSKMKGTGQLPLVVSYAFFLSSALFLLMSFIMLYKVDLKY